jgi:hypothetical protein
MASERIEPGMSNMPFLLDNTNAAVIVVAAAERRKLFQEQVSTMMRLNVFGSVCLLALWAGTGCSSDQDLPTCVADCTLCQGSSCPPDRCGLLVALGANCTDQVDFAEIALGQCLEEALVTPQESARLCSTIPVYQSSAVTVRSDGWVWQQTVTCTPEKSGRVIVLTLYCDPS